MSSDRKVRSDLKKELKQTFPDIKFVCATNILSKTHWVKWGMEIGTPATIDAVEEIASKYLSEMSIVLEPEISKERKEWSRKCVMDECSAVESRISFDWNWEFLDEKGVVIYPATTLYLNYRQNGVACFLEKEDGEPDEKRWYYEELKEEDKV
jgi:hypothetical protein